MPRSLAVLSALLLALPAAAHEFWIAPERYRAEPGQGLRVSLHHGERFDGEVVMRRNDSIQCFDLIDGTGSATPILGTDGRPVSFARPVSPGGCIAVYHSRRATNVLDAEAFTEYLTQEGLHAIVAMRADAGESGMPGNEVYSRCAKALIAVGGAPVSDRAVGLPLEIVLGTSGEPSRLVAVVSYLGEPLPGARVVAVHRDDPAHLIEATADDSGRVEIPAHAKGEWMLTALHMVRAPQDAGADWESFWASLTFDSTTL